MAAVLSSRYKKEKNETLTGGRGQPRKEETRLEEGCLNQWRCGWKTAAMRWDGGCVVLEQEEGGAWSPELLGCRRKITEDGWKIWSTALGFKTLVEREIFDSVRFKSNIFLRLSKSPLVWF